MNHTLEATIKDMVSDLLYYDRKEDEQLPLGEIERMIDDQEITVGEIVNMFTEALIRGLD